MEADLFGAKKPGSAPPQAKRSSPPGARAESTARAGGAGNHGEQRPRPGGPGLRSTMSTLDLGRPVGAYIGPGLPGRSIRRSSWTWSVCLVMAAGIV